MLTVTKPLALVLNDGLVQSSEGFAARIVENYRLMRERITAEDFIHVVTQPPEIFLLGGNDGIAYNETNIRNEQQNKVEIINNVVNRILLAADGKLSYQDDVYITNILHKIGIKDEKTFMEQVFSLAEETKNNYRLLRTYIDNRESFSQMIKEYRNRRDVNDTRVEGDTYKEILHLHEDVFKRWMAGDVYESQRDFRYAGYNVTNVTRESYQIAEHGRLAQQILLQQMREDVRGEQVPLVYHHENIYEGDDVTTQEVTEQSVINRLSSAVMLSLVDNIYDSTYAKVDHHKDNTYYIQNALYKAGDATFERVLNNTDYIESIHRNGDNYLQTKNTLVEENKLLEDMLNVRNEQIHNYFHQEEGDVFHSAETTYLTEGSEVPTATEEEIHVDERNTLEQRLYQTNRINVERQNQFIRNLSRLSETMVQGETERTAEDRREQQRLAFEHPEEFLRREMQQGAEKADREREYGARIEALYPESTQVVFNLIKQYLESPEAFSENQIIMPGAETLLYYDTQREVTNEEHERERLREEIRIREPQAGERRREYPGREAAASGEGDVFEGTTMTHVDRETLQREIFGDHFQTERIVDEDLTERTVYNTRMQSITEQILESIPGEVVQEQERVHSSLRLSHRVEEQAIDEEMLNVIRNQVRHNEQVTNSLKEEVKNITSTTERKIENITKEIVNIGDTKFITENVTPVIEPRHINEIANKVYSRIERQLGNERRRRGL